MNPYNRIESKSFWKTAISNINPLEVRGVWDPKFNIKTSDKVSTFGSCFAQHIGSSLDARGFNWFRPEKCPDGLSPASAREFNYSIFSVRIGNIYTVSLLRQWLDWAMGMKCPPAEVWETKDGKFIDPFRPNIEPNGFESGEELVESRNYAITKFYECISSSDYFVFTLGLTESWRNRDGDYVYPMCPGTAAGSFDSERHYFHNEKYEEIKRDLASVIKDARAVNPKLKFILTVSPVPLTATYSGRHVLVASSGSKSVLRAVCENFQKNRNIDYFPSYEIVSSPAFTGIFYNPNKRTVSFKGVEFVMDAFFSSLADKFGQQLSNPSKTTDNIDVVCEEELLEAFSK